MLFIVRTIRNTQTQSVGRMQYDNIGGTYSNHWTYGRAIAQAVSRWLPTAAARVRARV
jgi:hypothetical protein